MTQAIPQMENSASRSVLYLAFDLSRTTWRLGFSTGGRTVRMGSVTSGAMGALTEAIARARQRFGLPAEAPVRSCYEAGRDGFWLHRQLLALGIVNVVVDSSSIELNRRARQAKTDRLDTKKLLAMLVRYHEGEHDLWSVVRVPTVEQEDERRRMRELERLKKERTAHKNRMRGLLILLGLDHPIGRDFGQVLATLVLRDGAPLPTNVNEELHRELARLELVQAQIDELRRDQNAELRGSSPCHSTAVARELTRLTGVGYDSALPFAQEFFSWRRFRNRRELAAAAGLAPTPFASGDGGREQGISKAGNRRVRRVIIQVAWCWLRFQPASALSRWFEDRFGKGKGRMRRIGIVALSRKLLIAMWRFIEHGVVPDGASTRAPLKLMQMR